MLKCITYFFPKKHIAVSKPAIPFYPKPHRHIKRVVTTKSVVTASSITVCTVVGGGLGVWQYNKGVQGEFYNSFGNSNYSSNNSGNSNGELDNAINNPNLLLHIGNSNLKLEEINENFNNIFNFPSSIVVNDTIEQNTINNVPEASSFYIMSSAIILFLVIKKINKYIA